MANFTKTAIKTTFIKLLNEKPLSQITVKGSGASRSAV